MKKLMVVGTVLMALCSVQAAFPVKSAYRPSDDARARELLAKMTLDEKIGQLTQISGADQLGALAQDMSGDTPDDKVLDAIQKGLCGSILGCRGVEGYNKMQKAAMSSRLGIPLTIGHDMIHGAITDYPIPLALSCAWDTNLWGRVASAIAPETLMKGANWAFSPMLDLSRDARWGRIAESPGQDPLLGYLFGYYWTHGLQGDDMSVNNRIAASAKHFVGYGAAQGGRDYNWVEMSESTLRNSYLPGFRGAVAAGLATIMPAFHSWNDVPCSMNRYLLTDVLRGELGFTGFTISDYEAVWEMREGRHGTCANDAEMAAAGVNGGMDVEMLGGTYARGIRTALKMGILSEAAIDTAVLNSLRIKFAMGLFEHPYIDAEALKKSIDFAANRRLAREAAQKSALVLKSEGGVLPPKKSSKPLLLGESATLVGEMHGMWSTWDDSNLENATLLEGLKADQCDVTYVKGWKLGDKSEYEREAVQKAAANCDVIIACLGEVCGMTGENRSRANINLPGEQLAILKDLKALGKPLVVVLFNGRPMAIPELAEAADALVEAWQPGGCGGWGIADVLTGAVEPLGRLTTDFPHLSGECPKFYNCPKTGRSQADEVAKGEKGAQWLTRYLDAPIRSLFPFGYGLTYTTFAYAKETVKVEPNQVVFTVQVTNTGKRRGTELVQVYTRDRVAKIVRPRRELKAFERITLNPGESAMVKLVVPREDLGYWMDKTYVPGEGAFYGWIAPDSDSGRCLDFTL